MDKYNYNPGWSKQEELDYAAKIESAAKNGTGVPDHDCKIENGCEIEQDYHDSRAWWLEVQSKKTNQKLL